MRLQRAPYAEEMLKLRQIYLRAEQQIISEISRKQASGYVTYAEHAALDRVQKILQGMVDKSWEYVPTVVEKQYLYGKYLDIASMGEAIKIPAQAYKNASVLTTSDLNVINRLTEALMGTLTEGVATANKGIQTTWQESVKIARLESDVFRTATLEGLTESEATGSGLGYAQEIFRQKMKEDGITAFVDRSGRKWSLESYATMATRTTGRQATALGTLLADEEHDLYRISAHGSTCPVCAPLEGRVYSRSGNDPNYPPLAMAFGKIDPAGPSSLENSYLNIHPNCLLPRQSILAKSVVAYSQRYYCGEVVSIVTASGDKLSVTPNHPVLTPEGWVAAGALSKGDKVIKYSRIDDFLVREHPNDIHVPTFAEDIPHAFRHARGVSAYTVKGSSEQFHGDGIDSEITVVNAYRFLRGKRKLELNESISKLKLIGRRKPGGFFNTLCSFFKLSKASPCPAYSVMRRFCDFLTAFRRCHFVPVFHPFAARLGCDTVFTEAFNNSSFGNRKLVSDLPISQPPIAEGGKVIERENNFIFSLSGDNSGMRCEGKPRLFSMFSQIGNAAIDEGCNLLNSLSGKIEISDIIEINRWQWSGHVYNLQTESGWYVANSIITHNCLHVITKYTEDGRSDEEVEKMREFSSFETNPTTNDPRSQTQIKAYRDKERGRAKLLNDYRQYAQYRTVLGNDMPKTFQTFQKHKLAGSDKYSGWQSAYRAANRAAKGT